MRRAGRAKVSVPASLVTAGRNGSPAPVSTVDRDAAESRLDAVMSSVELPVIGPISERSTTVVSSWPSTRTDMSKSAPKADSTAMPSILNPALLSGQLMSMIREHHNVLRCTVNPDVETVVVLHFHILNECCKRLGRHFPAYRDVYVGMQQSITALNVTFGGMLQQHHEALAVVRATVVQQKEQEELVARERALLDSERHHLNDVLNRTSGESETIRVITTQNEDLFDQLQKMKRRVTEADEVSQQITSRNVVLQVNQSRLENEVERLNGAVSAAIAQHEAEKKTVDMKNRAIEALEQRCVSLQGRLDVVEHSNERANVEVKSMVDMNRSLAATVSRLQAQLQSVTQNATIRASSQEQQSRAGSPRFLKNGDMHRTDTPRPDWNATQTAIQADAIESVAVVAQLRNATSTKAKVKILSDAIVAQANKYASLHADFTAVKLQGAPIAPVPPVREHGSTPLESTLPQGARRGSRKSASTVGLQITAVHGPSKIKEVFIDANAYSVGHELHVHGESPKSDPIKESRPLLFPHPTLEIPKLDLFSSSQDAETALQSVWHSMLPMIADEMTIKDNTISARPNDELSGPASPTSQVVASPSASGTSGGDSSAVGHSPIVVVASRFTSHSTASSPANHDEASSPTHHPAKWAGAPPLHSFYEILTSPAPLRAMMNAVVDKELLSAASSLYPRLPIEEGVVRSFVRMCQDRASADAYAQLLIDCLSDTFPPDSIVVLRRLLDDLRTLLREKRDPFLTGCCDPIMFIASVKALMPYLHTADVEVLQRLMQGSAPTSAVASLPQSNSIVDLGKSLGVLIDSHSNIVSPELTLTVRSGEDEAVHGPFHYLLALDDKKHPVHQFLVRGFVEGLRSSQSMLRSFFRDVLLNPPSVAAGVAAAADGAGSSATSTTNHHLVTPTTLTNTMLKWCDGKRDRPFCRRLLSQLLLVEVGDLPPSARIDVASLVDAVSRSCYLHHAPPRDPPITALVVGDAPGAIGFRRTSWNGWLPVLETRTLDVTSASGQVTTPQQNLGGSINLGKRGSSFRRVSKTVTKRVVIPNAAMAE